MPIDAGNVKIVLALSIKVVLFYIGVLIIKISVLSLEGPYGDIFLL